MNATPPKPKTPLKLLRLLAQSLDVEPVCRVCRSFRGTWCERTDAAQIPEGVCLSWQPQPDEPEP